MKSLFSAKILVVALLLSIGVGSALAQEAAAPGAKVTKVQAILKVNFEEDAILPGLKNPFAIGQLQTFINNQVVLIKSQFVIKAALAPRDIAGLDLVRSQRNKDAWLFKSLDVQNPAGTSLLVLTLESPGDVDELKAVLDSVVTAYENEVVAEDVISSAERYRSADEYFKELKIDFGQLVERQQALAAELKGQDDSTEMRLLKIRIEVLEDLLMDAEKAARNKKMYVSIGASPVLVVQKAMVVPTP